MLQNEIESYMHREKVESPERKPEYIVISKSQLIF